ncbi:unnamed protein product [Moneuplotes crassus]|uniref:Uncharacterized protein n=1 Tax=Euplotes crassus TaxID=5936 RepID=A0AAD1UBB4_EUPCR|nr:unnamed protein product [Moneuplotes crassus]
MLAVLFLVSLMNKTLSRVSKNSLLGSIPNSCSMYLIRSSLWCSIDNFLLTQKPVVFLNFSQCNLLIFLRRHLKTMSFLFESPFREGVLLFLDLTSVESFKAEVKLSFWLSWLALSGVLVSELGSRLCSSFKRGIGTIFCVLLKWIKCERVFSLPCKHAVSKARALIWRELRKLS